MDSIPTKTGTVLSHVGNDFTAVPNEYSGPLVS